jgi:tRNA 2-thiouridine synthesizing protein B
MMTLHTLNRAPSHAALLTDCLNACHRGDALLLLEDGVYCALNSLETPLQLPDDVSCFALEADVAARGLSGRLLANVTLVDDAGFVQLCCDHARSISWF